ncbi:helix-turn-helix transcriptional regulator [Rhodococcoides fascians]|uniref:helix-turn-helix transcriptional regulator n=1 Tax=Rhodococcoides fascians TaxID=1828 RepID=UPI00050CB599|nr:helix-turn-helix domain-containing protein [Rhodococcus fascians]
MAATNPRLMDVHQLAEYLGVSVGTIHNNRRTHPLYSKAIKLGPRNSPLKWRRTDVDAYLESL